MTEYDFQYPAVESNRILINVLSKTITTIRAEHVAEWGKMWASSISIEAKDALTGPDQATFDQYNQYIKFALYNIYSVIRDDINVEVNPLNLSTLDLNGHIFWSAELWLLPVLLFLQPKAAKTLLDYRYYHLEKAKKLAAAHGYSGSKFAYENDTVGYNDIYWDTISPLYIFNTALISISAWNYYRVTRDQELMRRKGYEMLKNNADFFVSAMELDGTDGKYHLRNIIGMNNITADDNAVTNYLAKVAIKYAIEATYELNYIVDPNWTTVYPDVYVPVRESVEFGEGTYYNVIPVDDEDAGTSTNLKLLEPLLILMPYYNKDFFNLSESYDLTTTKANLSYYKDRKDAAFTNNAINLLLEGTLEASIAQQESTYVDKETRIENYQDDFLAMGENATMSPWKTLNNSLFPRAFNDIGVSALFLLSILTTMGGLRVRGGITSSRFLYEEYSIRSCCSGNVLPKIWKKLILSGIGHKSESFTITNVLYYP